jgi:anti-sigma regulatory factor (Ser/Thr protein kinase)
MEKEIVLELPLCSNNLLCARLTTFAVCSLMKIDINETEDIKVCVNEACLIMMNSRYSNVNVKYNMENNLKICVQGSGSCLNPINSDEDSKELSLMLLNSLVDEVDYKKDGGIISSIILTKRM